MTALFRDRNDAGRQLAAHLRNTVYPGNVIVLALPRGGVPVGYEVATALGAPLDVFVVRKLGVPGHEELAMGAVASGGVRVLNPALIRGLGVSAEAIERVTAAERQELERRESAYRLGTPFPDLTGRTVILVDDGVATGASMVATVQAVRQHHPDRIIAAAPVMSESALTMLAGAADACEAVATPEPFEGVGKWYVDFAQTSDEEVNALLTAARPGRAYANRS